MQLPSGPENRTHGLHIGNCLLSRENGFDDPAAGLPRDCSDIVAWEKIEFIVADLPAKWHTALQFGKKKVPILTHLQRGGYRAPLGKPF